MILTLRGTPFLYQGDELGMTNYPFKSIADFDDIEVKNAYKANVLTGKIPEDVFIANLRHTSRDNSRTPMQWDTSANGGFTTAAKPWLAENPNYTQINAAAEVADPNSIYNYTAKLIALRHAHQAFVYGDYKDLDPDNKSIFAYTRTLGTETLPRRPQLQLRPRRIHSSRQPQNRLSRHVEPRHHQPRHRHPQPRRLGGPHLQAEITESPLCTAAASLRI